MASDRRWPLRLRTGLCQRRHAGVLAGRRRRGGLRLQLLLGVGFGYVAAAGRGGSGPAGRPGGRAESESAADAAVAAGLRADDHRVVLDSEDMSGAALCQWLKVWGHCTVHGGCRRGGGS